MAKRQEKSENGKGEGEESRSGNEELIPEFLRSGLERGQFSPVDITAF